MLNTIGSRGYKEFGEEEHLYENITISYKHVTKKEVKY